MRQQQQQQKPLPPPPTTRRLSENSVLQRCARRDEEIVVRSTLGHSVFVSLIGTACRVCSMECVRGGVRAFVAVAIILYNISSRCDMMMVLPYMQSIVITIYYHGYDENI
jgi:hypothetical protein